MSIGGSPALPEAWARVGRQALLTGGAGTVIAMAIALYDFQFFLQGYLVGFLFWLGIALGCLGILMLHHLVAGAWGFLIRRPLEAGALTIPLMAILFIPVFLGIRLIYPWAQPDLVAADEVIRYKLPYLNVDWFRRRAVVYFVFWIALAVLLNRLSRAQDRTERTSPTRWSQAISGPGLALLFFTTTFAAIDWFMSLEPDWYSTIYGAMLIVGMALNAFCAMIIVAASLAEVEPLSKLAGPGPFHDLGNLLLAFVMLWAYMAFSQFLIVWSGNLREEIPWYLRRSAGGWRPVCAVLMVFHFFLPFFLLLFRESKRNPRNLWKIALVILGMQIVDDVWLIVPAFKEPRSWLIAFSIVASFCGIGGLWVTFFGWLLRNRPLVPQNDPVLAEILKHHHPGSQDHG